MCFSVPKMVWHEGIVVMTVINKEKEGIIFVAHPFGSEKLKINSMDMVRIRPREISKFPNCPRLTARLEDEKLQKYFNYNSN